MKKNKLLKEISEFCPEQLAEEWDNSGIQLSCGSENIDSVLVALEITNDVIDEAVENCVQMIITHHPMIFNPIKKVRSQDVAGNYLINLIQNNISVYSCHTNFDKVSGGNNDYIGKILKLNDVRPFSDDNGFCRMGETQFNTSFGEMISVAAEAFGISERFFKCTGDLSREIRTVGWCSGAGSEFIDQAINNGCDLYITGDIRYHEAQYAKEKGICLLDAGHYGTEKIFVDNMSCRLRDNLSEDIDIIESKVDLNPFK